MYSLCVVEADRGGERHPGKLGDIGGVEQEQPQALVVVVSEPRQVQIVVAGHGAALQQQPGNERVGRTGDRAAQRGPAAVPGRLAGAAVGVGAGVQQHPGHGQQALGPGRVEPAPPRGAGRVQRCPARPRVGLGGQAGIPAELGPHAAGVAQDHRGGEAVAGELGGGRQHPGRPARAVTDAGLAECFRLTGQARGVGGDLVPEPGPAGEAVLAGHGQLRAGQGQRVRHRPDAAGGRGVARPRGAQQVPGLAAQMIEAGPGRKIHHDLSFTGPRSARQAWQGRSP